MLIRAGMVMAGVYDAVRPGSGRDGFAQLLDPDRGRLELGGAGLRVGRVDRQEVRRDVVLEVEGHERQPGPQRLVDPDRRLDLAATRDDPDALAVGAARSASASSGEMSSDSPRRSGEV